MANSDIVQIRHKIFKILNSLIKEKYIQKNKTLLNEAFAFSCLAYLVANHLKSDKDNSSLGNYWKLECCVNSKTR